MKPIEEVELILVESFEDVQNFFRWLGERRTWLGWDTETGGLEAWKQPLRLFQFGDANSGWAFRADRWLGVAEEVFRTYEGRMTGQNVGFDVRFMKAQGGIDVPWGKQHDTRIMAHILDPTKSTSLKNLSARFLSPEAKRLQSSLAGAMKKQGWTWASVPIDFDVYWSYAALDPVLTARIAETFWPEVEANYFDVFALESETARICSNMELKGTMIDLDYCNSKREELLEFTGTADRWCVENYGLHPGQNQEVAIRLIKEGVDLSKTTATGDWAMDKDVLEGIDHPLASTVLAHRKATKISSTYFKNFLKMNNNGVLHPSINTLGARTARMSVQNPAVQTLPRGRVVRDGFIPRPGHVWLCVDFDNIEMKLLAHFCQDPGMMEAAKTSDMHLEMAKLAFHDDGMQKSDTRRQVMKNSNFAKAFVAGVDTFALTAGIDLLEAQTFLDLYDSMFPGVKAFQQNVIKTVQKRYSEEGVGWVKSPLGRRHVADKDKAYAAVNYLIQGCLPADAPVLTRYGWKPISSWVDGEEAWTGAEWAPATLIERGCDSRIRLHISDGRLFDCDTRHKLLVHDEAWPRWATMDEIVGLPLVVDSNTDWGVKSKEPEDWYWLGRFIGDGSMSPSSGIWTMAWGPNEGQDYERFKRWAGARFAGKTSSKLGWSETWGKYGISQILGGTANGRQIWFDLGFQMGWKARTKRIPAGVFALDKERRLAFIQGYMDADGKIRKDKKQSYDFLSSVNESLLRDTLNLAYSVGMRGHIRQVKWGYDKGSIGFELSFRQNSHQDWIKQIYVTEVEDLDVTEPMYTLSVDHERHAFSSSGLISKNTAAEAFKSSLVDLDHAGYGDFMLLPVHDEQNFEVPFELAADMEFDIQQIMIRKEYALPLTVSSSMGSTWGEAK